MAFCIALVGMPGAGKSTVGKHVARALALPFFDSDVEVEHKVGMSVRAYFDTHGEAQFRDLEQRVIDDLSERSCVFATGGGSVLRDENRRRLKERCTVVYLRSSPEELYRRLRHDKQRPLLQVDDPQRKLRDLYQARDPLYRSTAHYVIETGKPSVASLTNMILMQLELAGVVSALRPGTGEGKPVPD